MIPTIIVRAPHDVRTVASRCPYDMYNCAGIVRAPCGHHKHGVSRYVTAQATVVVESYDV